MQLSIEEYKAIVDQSQIMIWRSGKDTLCNYFNSAWLNFTGKTIEEELGNGWANSVHPDDYDRCLSIYLDNFEAQRPFIMEYRLKRQDGKYRWIYDKGVPFYDDDGVFQGYIGSCFDIHDSRKHQDRIKSQVQEKEVLLKEVHHRVKNNLQLLNSLMHLQGRQVKDRKLRALYEETESRVLAIAKVHERLYKSENMSELNFSVYLKELITDLLASMDINNYISLDFICPPITLSINTAIPLGILVNEVVTNAIKYGTVDNEKPEITIHMSEPKPRSFLLCIGDNGNGFNDEESSIDLNQSLGLNLINILSKQIDANLELDENLKGVNYRLSFEDHL